MSYNVDFPMIKGGRTSVVKNAGVDYSTRRAEDYVGVLNRVSEAVGAVPNMGIYADITGITYCTMLRIDVEDHYIDVATSTVESPKKTRVKNNNVSSVENADLDMFAGRGTDTVTGILDGTIENHRCNPTVECDQCDGNGKCSDCGGTGKVTCSNCDGDGDCRSCDGEGWVECYRCRGTGDCPSCNGTGWSDSPCPECGGSGKVMDEETGRKRKCETCDGHGVLPCTVCAKSRVLPNRKPGKCPVCIGKGDLKCSECSGTGKCQTCRGRGTVNCETCKGGGKCKKCKGSGKLKCPRCEGSGWYQTYEVFEATRVVRSIEWVSNGAYGKLLGKAQGRSVFSGRVKKWKRENVLEYDHSDRFRAAVTSAFGGDSRVYDEFVVKHNKMVELRYGIRYCSDADAIVVPAVRIDFVLEHVPHSMVIIGTNGVVVHDSLPRRLEQYRVGFFSRIGMSFNRSRRHMEYIKLAAYIMQIDGRSPEESRLLNAFVRSLGYSNAKSKRLMAELAGYDASMDYNTLREEIRHLLKSKRVLTFAWHCMERDGVVSDQENALWLQLAAEFGIGEAEQASLKRNASRFALLGDEALVEEYLRK